MSYIPIRKILKSALVMDEMNNTLRLHYYAASRYDPRKKNPHACFKCLLNPNFVIHFSIIPLYNF